MRRKVRKNDANFQIYVLQLRLNSLIRSLGCKNAGNGARCLFAVSVAGVFFVVVLFLVISRGGGLFHAEEEVVFLAFLDEDVFVVEEEGGGCGGVDVADFLFVD